MTPTAERYDVLVLGTGPAGQKAAVQAAKSGRKVLVVDREAVGGECVHRGTIPSKTLRESALYLAGLRQRAVGLAPADLGAEVKVASLMQRLADVQSAHEAFIGAQIARNGIATRRGRARFVGSRAVEITALDGSRTRVEADVVLIATGSRPRRPAEIEVDHEHVCDSDSILSLIYLPGSLVVLGAGVIAAEFATIFQALGVRVTMVDRGERPLGFLDPEIADLFVRRFRKAGGTFLAGEKPVRAAFDGFGAVEVALASGRKLAAEKVLVALGRSAALAGLDVEAAGLAPNERGFLSVDANGETAVRGIYAAGDVIGPPALAAAAMEQGRRAMRHALGLEVGPPSASLPSGIYTIPEIASVGLTEAEAIARDGRAIVGRARFEEIARGQISGETDGLLKLVADPSGTRLLGAQIIGEGAAELVHLAQMALVGAMDVDVFVDQVFNFPTLAEAYRVAALDVVGQRPRLRAVG